MPRTSATTFDKTTSPRTWIRNGYLAACVLLLFTLIWPLAQGDPPFDLGLDLAGGALVTYRADLEQVPDRYRDLGRADLLEMARDTLVGRLLHRFDTLPEVVLRDDGRLVASLPGAHDRRDVLESIGQTHRLTFRRALAVHDTRPDDAEGWLRFHEGRWLDLGEELLSGDALDPGSIRVEMGAGAPGRAGDPGYGATVTFAFEPPFDERFAEITLESVGQTLVILLDDRVEWAGEVQEQIRGRGSLRGGYDAAEAAEVAGLLRAGTLPVPLHIEGLDLVGPSLGQAMLEQGRAALIWSAGLLALLVGLAYSHRPALLLVGWGSLGLLLLFILGLIRAFGLTLDLAAIAGLMLSVGMGMDAFILIFEALDGGLAGSAPSTMKSPLGRLRDLYGFRGEGRTLLHANATTLVVISLLLAVERLRSFAVFVVVGLLASLATLWATRRMLEWFARRGWLEGVGDGDRQGILSRLRHARPVLVRFRRLYFAAVAMLVGSVALLAHLNGGDILSLGPDFQPGMQLQVVLPDPDQIVELVADLGDAFPGLRVRHQAWDSPETADEPGFLITMEGELGVAGDPERLASWIRDRSVAVHGLHAVDARLSAERLLSSLSVLGVSFFLLGVYLAKLQRPIDRLLGAPAGAGAAGGRLFVGTVVAVAVDVVVVLAILAWLGQPVGLSVVAALLSIIGYSVNDSMVLACHLPKPAGGTEVGESEVRDAVDRILSRATLTSLSTLLPAVAILAVDLTPLKGFAWAIVVGTVAGTLSSMFVVPAFLYGPVAAGKP